MKNKKNKELFIYSCSSIILIITLIVMVFVLEYISTKEQNINKEEQEQTQEVQNIEIVIPEQNNYGTIEIYDSEGNVIQTMAHGEIKIINDGKNGEPIKILMCAGKGQKVEQSK